MKRKIHIEIPKPCHENWDAMTITEKGKFCKNCQKDVIDFTKASDNQIIDSINATQNLCGRFSSTQLNRPIYNSNNKNTNWLKTIGLISFFSLASQKSFAQNSPIIVQTDTVTNIISKPNDSIKTKLIKGVVSDDLGVVAGANVLNKNKNFKTTTDFDGKFEIEAESGDIIEVSYFGSKNSLIVDNNTNYNVKTETIELISIGLIKKRTFLGSIFHKIGNLFR